MNTELRLFAALGVLALVQGAAAAPTLTVKRPPTGLTAAQLQQKLAPILAAHKQEQATREQQSTAQIRGALSAIEPESKILKAALARDPRYSAMLDQARSISLSKADAVTRAAQMKALLGANRVIFSDAIRSSGISATALQSKTGNLVVKPDLNFQFKVPPPRKSGTLASSGGTAAPIPDLILQPPFDFEATDTNNGGLAYSAADADARVDRGTSKMHATIIGLAGTASGSADVGQTIEVPAGVDRVEVTVSAKISYSGSALAVIGLGFGCTSVDVELWTADLEDRIDTDGHFECATAPLGWYAEMSGDETRDHLFVSNVARDGRHLIVLGSTYANASGGGAPGYGEGQSKAEITKIRVHFIKN